MPGGPGTAEIVADEIRAAITKSGMHPGIFSLIQGAEHQTGAALVQHPLISTGSLAGRGRAPFDLCAARPEPIPFLGEPGSGNPMFFFVGSSCRAG